MNIRDSWAKIERARLHLHGIYDCLEGFLDGEAITIPLKSIVGSSPSEVCRVVACLPNFPPDIGLRFGDIVHNYRSSLDYVWWQVVSHNMGREPEGREANDVMFPICHDEDKWGKGKRFGHVSLSDAEFAKSCQPFNAGEGEVSPLDLLFRFSNIDKHRALNLVLATYGQMDLKNNSDRLIKVHVFDLPEMLGVGDVVSRIEVEADGLNLDEAFEGELRLHYLLPGNIPALQLLEHIDAMCERILTKASMQFCS